MTPYDNLALVVVGLCALAANECAVLRVQTLPRLAAAMRFFALAWAVLLPFYALQPYLKSLHDLGVVAEFLPTYSGVLLLLTAEPLWREASHRGVTMGGALRWMNYVTERALYLLVLPHAILFAQLGPNEQLIILRLVDLVLGVAGFVFIGVALRMLTSGFWRRSLWWGFVPVAIVYTGAHTWWIVDFIQHPNDTVVKTGFVIAFAICKLALSITFLAVVMSVRSSEDAPPDKGKAATATPHN